VAALSQLLLLHSYCCLPNIATRVLHERTVNIAQKFPNNNLTTDTLFLHLLSS